METCSTCRYFHSPCGLTRGECRRSSPQVVGLSETSKDPYLRGDVVSYRETCWPRIDSTDWCGEWERKL
jgi:hypothetical protein